MERNVNATTAQWRLRASQKAERYIALARKKAQQQQGENNDKLSKPEIDKRNKSPVKGKQKEQESSLPNNSKQSDSYCDTVDKNEFLLVWLQATWSRSEKK